MSVDQILEHQRAMLDPKTEQERAFVKMLGGLQDLCFGYRKETGGELIGDDGLFSDYLTDYVRAVKMFLNGERGRIDGASYLADLRTTCALYKIPYPE